jgi:hypothetical protein
MPVTSGQPHGTRAQCLGLDGGVCCGQCGSGSTSCTYPGPTTECAPQKCVGVTKSLASGCNQGGACNAQMTFTCPQGCHGNTCLGACTSDGDCMAADANKPFCDTSTGTCTPKRPNGHTCSAGADCTSTYCVDNYCCDGPCAEQCQTCRGVPNVAPPGTCAVTIGAVVNLNLPTRMPCTTSGSACDGSCDGKSGDTKCQYPAATTLCGSCCHGGSVDKCDGAGHCSTSGCTTGTCALPSGCGDCNTTRACQSSSQCTSGNCLGQVCCASSSCPQNDNEVCDLATGACDCVSSCGDGSYSSCGQSDGCGYICNLCVQANAPECCGSQCCDPIVGCNPSNTGCN